LIIDVELGDVGFDLREIRIELNGIAISTVYPRSLILPADAQIASQESSSLLLTSSNVKSICVPSGLTKNSNARR
jgi:hypothetical protein